jgi:ABC-type transporter Mla subunit MlaD
MREQIEQRLAELKTEFETGQKMLAELDQKRAGLEQTLLRISGAIQVLDEMLAADQPSANGAQTSASAVAAFMDNGRA